MTDTEDAIRLVQNFTEQSDAYERQLHIWLGAASAGGVLSLLSFASAMPDPTYALKFFMPSLFLFLLGITTAGLSTLALARRAASKGQHFASSGTRDSINEKIRSIPEKFSMPRSLADEMNKPRNDLIRQSQEQHDEAERAWRQQAVWKWLWLTFMSVSCVAFLAGFSIPLANIGFFEGHVTP